VGRDLRGTDSARQSLSGPVNKQDSRSAFIDERASVYERIVVQIRGSRRS